MMVKVDGIPFWFERDTIVLGRLENIPLILDTYRNGGIQVGHTKLSNASS